MSTTDHCPGFHTKKNLKSYFCKCSECKTEKEIFSDELDKIHKCTKCGTILDLSQCKIGAGV